MGLNVVFRTFAVSQLIIMSITLIAPESMVKSFGTSFNTDTLVNIQFFSVFQLMLALVTFALPAWLGTNLWKAAPTYIWLSLLPFASNMYHVTFGMITITGIFYVENTFWLVFAFAFYSFGKRMKLRF